MMKTLTWTILLLFVAAGSAWAAKVHDIANTPHNLSPSQPDALLKAVYSATDEDEICVFCHTPHGGSLDGPLWNRDISGLTGAGVYTHYTSDTLSSAVGASNRAVSPRSLLCLSCHDGSIGVGDNLYSNPSGTPDNSIKDVQSAFGRPGPRIGGRMAPGDPNDTVDLSDDHPISFSYTAVAADKPGTLNAFGDVETAGLVLFEAAENVECSTCHDPHVSYLTAYGGDADYDPFLAIPNTGSQMCLTCHIK